MLKESTPYRSENRLHSIQDYHETHRQYSSTPLQKAECCNSYEKREQLVSALWVPWLKLPSEGKVRGRRRTKKAIRMIIQALIEDSDALELVLEIVRGPIESPKAITNATDKTPLNVPQPFSRTGRIFTGFVARRDTFTLALGDAPADSGVKSTRAGALGWTGLGDRTPAVGRASIGVVGPRLLARHRGGRLVYAGAICCVFELLGLSTDRAELRLDGVVSRVLPKIDGNLLVGDLAWGSV